MSVSTTKNTYSYSRDNTYYEELFGEKPVLTIKEICYLTGLSVSTIRRRIGEGILKKVTGWNTKNKILITRTSLNRYLRLNGNKINTDSVEKKNKILNKFLKKNPKGEISVKTNVINIEKNIPVPRVNTGGSNKRGSALDFIKDLKVGDSFLVNKNNFHFKPLNVQNMAYKLAAQIRKEFDVNFKITSRTITGTCDKPESIRIWRIS